ncbi:helix-turn-helix domain-containing protein [Sphingobacterium corticis]|uniref:Helix-turn-helix domain-containing protein n=1 Tax=Sphingobacterium corticis TaxID=1812823 RepID=A0ABW5NK33_9SPHI
MNVEIITKRDLEVLKTELIHEIRNMRFTKQTNASLQKEWLKTYEVLEMLGISPGTLQNLRQKGVIPYSKIGGLIFYKLKDIESMLCTNQS